jgi:hypothetical protein
MNDVMCQPYQARSYLFWYQDLSFWGAEPDF